MLHIFQRVSVVILPLFKNFHEHPERAIGCSVVVTKTKLANHGPKNIRLENPRGNIKLNSVLFVK